MKSLRLILPFASLLLLSSCGKFLYRSPSAHNNLFEKQNDINAQLNISDAGTEIYGAWSPINNLGVSAGYSTFKGNDDTNSVDGHNYDQSRFSELQFTAFPYYAKDVIRLEMPIGIGMPQKKSLHGTYQTYAPYNRLFVQPTVGFSWEEVQLALFCRITQLDYKDPALGTDTRYEPGFMFRGGSKNIQGMMQFRLNYGTNYSKSKPNYNIYDAVEYWPFYISMGINFNLNPADFKKKKS